MLISIICKSFLTFRKQLYTQFSVFHKLARPSLQVCRKCRITTVSTMFSVSIFSMSVCSFPSMASSSGDPPPNRARADLAKRIASTGVQLSTQARGHGISKKSVSNELHKYDQLVTPYGKLYTELDLPTRQGPIPTECANPFAMLWHILGLRNIDGLRGPGPPHPSFRGASWPRRCVPWRCIQRPSLPIVLALDACRHAPHHTAVHRRLPGACQTFNC